MEENDKYKRAFVSNGVWGLTVCHKGSLKVTNGRCMGKINLKVLVVIDDLIVFAPTLEDNDTTYEGSSSPQSSWVVVSIEKCTFFRL